MTNGCAGHQDKIIEKLEKVEENLGGKIEDINKRLFEPDNGVYARIGKNTAFRKTTKRWLSMITVGFVGAIGKALYEFFKGR